MHSTFSINEYTKTYFFDFSLFFYPKIIPIFIMNLVETYCVADKRLLYVYC